MRQSINSNSFKELTVLLPRRLMRLAQLKTIATLEATIPQIIFAQYLFIRKYILPSCVITLVLFTAPSAAPSAGAALSSLTPLPFLLHFKGVVPTRQNNAQEWICMGYSMMSHSLTGHLMGQLTRQIRRYDLLVQGSTLIHLLYVRVDANCHYGEIRTASRML